MVIIAADEAAAVDLIRSAVRAEVQAALGSREWTERPGRAPPLALSYREASRLCGLSVSTLRRRVAAGRLRVVRNGRRVLVERDELERMLRESA